MNKIKTIDDLINDFEKERCRAKKADFRAACSIYGGAMEIAKQLKANMQIKQTKQQAMLDARIAMHRNSANEVGIDFKEMQYRLGKKHEAEDIEHLLRLMEIDYE